MTAYQPFDISGRTAVVTGSSRGIGLALATGLARAGCTVAVHGSDEARCRAAADTLAAEGLPVTVVNCRYLKPYDQVTLAAVLANHRQLLVVEEGTVVNGFGAFMAATVAKLDPAVKVYAHGVPDRFIHQASRARQLAACGLDAAGIAARVRALHESEALAG